MDFPSEQHNREKRLEENSGELRFLPTNLTKKEASKIALKILQKQNFYISKALGYQKKGHILGKQFTATYKGTVIYFRAIDCSYKKYDDIMIYGSQIVTTADVRSTTDNIDNVRYYDIYEYDPITKLRSLVGRRYEFNTSLPKDFALRTCWLVVEAKSISDFERIME